MDEIIVEFVRKIFAMTVCAMSVSTGKRKRKNRINNQRRKK
jgi:hypothetical protein